MRQSFDAGIDWVARSCRSHDTWRHLLAVLLAGGLCCAPLQAGVDGSPPAPMPVPPADIMQPEPGRLVEVGGFRLHLYCTGQGQGPTVVLEAGLGGFSLEWDPVQSDLSASHRVCSYDRAGYGWSDTGPAPRTVERLVQELSDLLVAGDVPGPYVLVGHSFGGYVVQLFAKRYPARTAGVVLVDSSHPDQFRLFPASQRALQERAGRRQATFAAGVRLPANFPARWRELAERLSSQRKSLRALAQEYRDFVRSGAQVQAAGTLPDVPAVVLTRGLRQWPQDADGDAMEAVWPVLQDELADAMPRAYHFRIAASGHHIHLDQPAAVDEAVRLVFERLDCTTRTVSVDPASAGQC
jgi:pimeloyl-ACP methyl ester carboxylesterase